MVSARQANILAKIQEHIDARFPVQITILDPDMHRTIGTVVETSPSRQSFTVLEEISWEADELSTPDETFIARIVNQIDAKLKGDELVIRRRLEAVRISDFEVNQSRLKISMRACARPVTLLKASA